MDNRHGTFRFPDQGSGSVLEVCLHKLLLDAWTGLPNVPAAAPVPAPHPVVELAQQLAGQDIGTLDDAGTIDFLKGATRLHNMVQSLVLAALHRFTVLRPATGNEAGAVDGYSRFAAGEVSAALALGEAAARKNLNDAAYICTQLPATAAAMASGELDLKRGTAIARASADLPPEILPEFEAAAVPGAGTITRQGVEARARTARHHLHPEPLQERHRRAYGSRDVALVPLEDGMAEVWIRTGADKAFLIYHRVQALARSLQGPGEARILPQLRADVVTDLLLGTGTGRTRAAGTADMVRCTRCGRRPGAGPTVAGVAVTLSLETAAGLSNQPGSLAGYGPIPAARARELAALAKSWLPVLTDGNGRAIAAAARLRIAPEWLKRQVRLRDRRCRFPGCRRAAVYCDIDHVTAWKDGGETVLENLQCLCDVHHAAKQHGGWTARPGPDGRIQWTAPTGHRYTTDPDDDGDIALPVADVQAEPAGGEPGPEAPPPF
ncbi:HNH endonuclease signature motif containing protein [Arthrobacter mobilis]|uniref:DUF222 domain-containing protein n=1 Tax=Arthrobacter mobilis TaxID=2724944 RepID=A0A7X6K6N4_9MICC|nr:HNH endonuclease signature motif containing protein [Arthrobacter mobilis]NKX55655.1 DUF222 domain-containing protein [Arthrobacter mobilis]